MAFDSSARWAAHPSMVLAAYLEPLVRGRRVAIFGDATTGLGDRIVQRGARLVHAYDPVPTRAAEAIARGGGSRTVAYATLEPDLGVRDGAFDVAVLPDLSAFEDPADVLRRARRLVGANGVAVVAVRNGAVARQVVPSVGPEAPPKLGYYELFDLVSLQFPVVRMVGQAPFVGYALAEFAPEEEPDVSVDTSLLEATEEPEWFVAIGSGRPLEIESFALVEVPFSDLFGTADIEPVTIPTDRRAGEATERIRQLQADLDRATERMRETEASNRLGAAASSRLAEVEQELATKSARLHDLEAKLGDDHVRAERLTHDIRDLEEELARQRDRATRLTKQLDDEKKARTKSDVELGMIRAKPELTGGRDRIETLTAELEAARARVADLEGQAARAPKPDPALPARIAEIEASLRSARDETAATAAARDAAVARATMLEAALTDAKGRQTELERRLEAAEAKAAAPVRDDASFAEQAADIAALEAALSESGRRVRELTKDLKESERIGKELILELEELRAPTADKTAGTSDDAASAPEGTDGEASWLRRRLDTLAEAAAKSQADLQAASWRIAELEQRLSDAQGEPMSVHDELEQALVAAHDEVARLRRSLAERSPNFVSERQGSPSEPPGEVIEQAVLLHQLAAERNAP